MMTRKHFEFVADIVKQMRVGQADRELMAKLHAKQFAKENPRFDKKKFFKACGV